MPKPGEVGERLRKLRKKKGKTIMEASSDLKIAASSLTAYELGLRTPRDYTKEKIARYYGDSVGHIFF
ncbi:helix-turn-helix domain-containing protein [Acidaminococcus sp. DS4831]|uniref:helix-turn-helix domain-containing protein n=1 Tax=Acidaminococcus sp. DS4831 TaxID=3141399 RepID=UPI0032E41132